MKLIKDKKECCGCTACMHVCPVSAIRMIEDEEGFLYPKIDEKNCINCNMCVEVCPIHNYKHQNSDILQKIYAVKHKDEQVVMSSSSGGMFTAVSDYILSQNGIVYGAAFDDTFRVCHQRAETKSQRDCFKGSKYVQSDLSDTYVKIKEDLKRGKRVLFTGTPCQNSGLQNYLEKNNIDISYLICCDFVCHGTPSPLIWREYINFLENKFQDKLIDFSFRDKSNGWRLAAIRTIFKNGVHNKECNSKISFLHLYTTRFIIRPVCFECKFTSYKRVSDITIADFWNIERSNPRMDDNKGTSLVLLNTEKGINLFNYLRENLYYEQSTAKDCWQLHLQSPCVEPQKRGKFWNEFKVYGERFIFYKYGKGTVSSRLIKKLTPTIRKMGLYAFANKVYLLLFGKKAQVNKAK